MKRVRAFTLVELLVALSITVILVLMLTSVVAATLGAWSQGRNRLDTYSNARQVIGRLSDELSAAIAVPSPNFVEFSENLSITSFLTGGPTPTPSPQPTPQRGRSENVFFVTPYPNLTAGDLCVVAYRHIDTDDSPQHTNSHTLQRAFLDSQTAWSIGTQRFQSNAYATLPWRTIATGVLEFEIQAYSQYVLDNNKLPILSWNSITGPDPSDPHYESSDNTIVGNAPRQILIRIKVIDDRTAAKIVGLVPGNSLYDQVVSRSAREFTATVSLIPPR